ncbi:MAG: efflux RND transporter periplasmic adaptor subunit, partial [Coriobacteriales bacterium]|nr:efflux RND transporter periplasmic adaptor subunit [Coriobacteriales bacterium]
KTTVEVGATTDTQVQIVSGVEEGDQVALSGAETLTDGMSVRVKE